MPEIPLSKGHIALVDEQDYEWLSGFKWHVVVGTNTVYAQTIKYEKGKQKYQYMHRMIMDAPQGTQVDHKNRVGTDNRRENLRLATRAQNSQNRPKNRGSSKYKGVSLDKKSNNWVAHIRTSERRITIGHYKNEEDAALAYDRAQIAYFKEFSVLNFPGGDGGRVLVKEERTRGETHHNAKLTNDQAIEIFRRAKLGENKPSLAKKFGITHGAVTSIVRGDTWAHIKAEFGDSF